MRRDAPRGDGAFVVVEAIAVDRAELREDLDLLTVVEGDLGLLLEDLDELVEVLRALVETAEGAERFGVRRIAVEHLVPELDADLGLLDALGGELRDVEELASALVAVEAIGFFSLETEELLPVAALLVHAAQVVDGSAVLGIDRDDRFVGFDGLGLVRELAGVELGGLRIERDLLFRVGDHGRELEERLDVLVVTLVRFLLVGERAKLCDLAGIADHAL